MPINPDAAGTVGEPKELSWTSKDSLLYALGVGAGQTDPTGFELEFTTENSNGVDQRAFPTQVVVMGGGGMPDFGDFNLAALLHGEQHITIHQTIPAEGEAIVTGNIGEADGVYFGSVAGGFDDGVRFGPGDADSYSLALADLDGDGDLDVVVGHADRANAAYLNDGDGKSFTAVTFGMEEGVSYGVAVGDVDGDGRLDIGVANSGGPNRVFLNRVR